MTATLKLLSTGVGLSIQDFGRAGWRRYGVPSGGAMDRHAMAAANQLLGNRANVPVLEILMQGARIEVLADTWVAIAGADLGCALEAWTAAAVTAGTILSFPRNRTGLFTYLALPGGIEADLWLGSASVDARIGLGRPLAAGDLLSAKLSAPAVSTERIARRMLLWQQRRTYPEQQHFELLLGPQYDQFSVEARAQLVGATWQVSARSDRTGFRLEGPNLAIPDSIPSEPVLPGSIQIPGNGQPIITMADGPTVGGYAKLAVLRQADLEPLAQCAPGTQITFTWSD
jgi:biotin-dependent carboxylase-like uncharacterized protein